MSSKTRAYVLGHSDQELVRLARQAKLIDPPTHRFFVEAGITSGMRVLDIGSGAGHTAFVAAELVGATGEVIGTDRSLDAIKTAQANAQARNLGNVSFLHCDSDEMTFEHTFDAVVGRYVLVHNADQSSMLRRLSRHLRPDGVMLFQEPTMGIAQSFPPVDLYERCRYWYMEGLRAGGAQIDTAYRLHSIFVRAGLPPPTMRMHVAVGGAPGIFEYLHLVVDIVRTLLPVLEEHGIATADEIDIDCLADRLCRDVAANDSTILGGASIAAWSRVPSAEGQSRQ
jgi:2-polyprenyl-3-methyl-5-hydroxy-6-metoxy-1,4-benzoquinol methylase